MHKVQVNSSDTTNQVWIATGGRLGDHLSAGDQVLADQLAKLGVELIPWNWESAIPQRQLPIWIRSTWNYYEKLDAFLQRIDELHTQGFMILNPPITLRWNSNKTYLRELEEYSVPTIPTLWIYASALEQITEHHVRSTLNLQAADQLILKPAVSAGSHKTHKFNSWSKTRAYLAQDFISNSVPPFQPAPPNSKPSTPDWMLQKFETSIADAGEVSLVFFNFNSQAQLSHIVRKQPQLADFRVQPEFGGKLSYVNTPTAQWLQICEQCFSSLKHMNISWFCARVDLVNPDSKPQLIELELIEPDLYWQLNPNSDAIIRDLADHLRHLAKSKNQRLA